MLERNVRYYGYLEKLNKRFLLYIWFINLFLLDRDKYPHWWTIECCTVVGWNKYHPDIMNYSPSMWFQNISTGISHVSHIEIFQFFNGWLAYIRCEWFLQQLDMSCFFAFKIYTVKKSFLFCFDFLFWFRITVISQYVDVDLHCKWL